jgi:hypothetical protein
MAPCPLCQRTDDMHCGEFSDTPICLAPSCIYQRALAKAAAMTRKAA